MARRLVIDTCCMLNLLATKRAVEILRALDFRLLVSPQVCGESRSLSTPPDENGDRAREAVSVEPLREAGLLETVPLDGPDLLDAFVAAAAEITDTDASCIALAGVLKAPLLTDDQKERRIAQALFSEIQLVSTLDLVADAAEALEWSAEQLCAVAYDLRWRGNFLPPRRDPRGAWYLGLLTPRS